MNLKTISPPDRSADIKALIEKWVKKVKEAQKTEVTDNAEVSAKPGKEN